jgi:hypothetical protein
MIKLLPDVIEPAEWFIVFHTKSATRWLGLITPGRYKHVSMVGYMAVYEAWLLYDVRLGGTCLQLLTKAAALAWMHDCDVIQIKPTGAHIGLRCRFGFTCVTAVKHLLGLLCVAPTPTALYRHILRNGGIPIGRRCSGTSGRPQPSGRADTGAERSGLVAAD